MHPAIYCVSGICYLLHRRNKGKKRNHRAIQTADPFAGQRPIQTADPFALKTVDPFPRQTLVRRGDGRLAVPTAAGKPCTVDADCGGGPLDFCGLDGKCGSLTQAKPQRMHRGPDGRLVAAPPGPVLGRVTRPADTVLVYDLDNPNPFDVL